MSATLGQTTEKIAASLSIVNAVANASYIYMAYLYPKSDGPKCFWDACEFWLCICDDCTELGIQDLVAKDEQEDWS